MTENRDRRGPTGTVLRDTAILLATAARLLARHWPVLLALFLASILARELVLRAALQASLVSAELGVLVLLLAPMATLIALVLMLRTVRPSLPYLRQTSAPPPPIEHLGSVLVPFLGIYYFEDFLYEDMSRYLGDLLLDDVDRIAVAALAGEAIPGPDRLPFTLTITLGGVVVAAFVGRWLLARWQSARHRPWLGIPGAYLELVWLTLVYIAFFQTSQLILAWGGERRLVHATQAAWDEAVGTVTGLAVPLGGVYEWLGDQFGQFTAVIVVPVAWLAIGAVVLGYQPRPASGPSRMAVPGQHLYGQAEQRWSAAPGAVQWLGKKLTADLRGRFTPLVHGTRMLVRAGIAPMLLFCLAFVAARTAADWLWELQRLLIGGQDPAAVWHPLVVPLGMVNQAIGYVLMICLLAAAIDRAVHASEPPAALPALTDPAPEAASGQPTSNRA